MDVRTQRMLNMPILRCFGLGTPLTFIWKPWILGISSTSSTNICNFSGSSNFPSTVTTTISNSWKNSSSFLCWITMSSLQRKERDKVEWRAELARRVWFLLSLNVSPQVEDGPFVKRERETDRCVDVLYRLDRRPAAIVCLIIAFISSFSSYIIHMNSHRVNRN